MPTFVFNPIKGVPVNVQVVSNGVFLYDIPPNSEIIVTNGEYSLNGGSFVSSMGSVSTGDSVELRVTSSPSYNTSVTCSVSIGGLVSEFVVTTLEISSVPDFYPTDYLSEARERVTEQFSNAPVFDKFLQLITSEATNIQNLFKDLIQRRWLTTARGKQLDVIGDIVGQPRDLFDSVIIYYFGFQGATGALSFGTRANPNVGGIFKSRNDPLRGMRSLTDSEYLALIEIKILKNSTRGVIDDFIQMARILFDVSTVVYTEVDAVLTINIGRDFNDPALSHFKGLDEIELAEKYLPVPIGVRLEFDGNIL